MERIVDWVCAGALRVVWMMALVFGDIGDAPWWAVVFFTLFGVLVFGQGQQFKDEGEADE